MTRSRTARLALACAGGLALIAPAAVVSGGRAAGAAPMALTLVWNRNLPGVTFRESSPVLANLGRRAVAVGGLDARLYAFDAATGADMPGFPAITSSPSTPRRRPLT